MTGRRGRATARGGAAIRPAGAAVLTGGLVAGLVTGLLAGCSGGTHSAAAAAGGVQQVTVHVTDQLRFRPAAVRVHTGTVRITLIDDGSYPHDLSVRSLHVTSPDVTGNPGQHSTTLTLHLAHAGTYPFVCTYHDSAGMRGRLIVG